MTLLIVDPVHLSLGDHGTHGVYLTQKTLSRDAAEIEVRALVTNELATATEIVVEAEVADASGMIVASDSAAITVAAGNTASSVQTLRIARPHRWQGRSDPYLYQTTVHVSRGGRRVDRMSSSLGLRSVAIDEARGFLLNGEPYPVHGVSRHQDRLDRGTALSVAEQVQDVQLMLDMGVTAVRLAFYPQSETMHQLADRSGLLLWEEIPNVERVPSLPEFAPMMK